MPKSIVIVAEKPSVAQAVAAWLARKLGVRAVPKGRTHIEVGDYRVSWLFGHVLGNAEPHDYDPSFKKWSAADLPIVPREWKLNPKGDAADQIRAVKALLKEATEVIGLGDPDQEGQLLQDEFLRWAHCKAPVKRLWLNALDDSIIEAAWKAMRPNKDYEGYYWSALARSHADWLMGINGTRACTIASQNNGGNALLPVGRVQTPTLALVVNREKEIRAFKPVNYFTPYIQLGTKPAFKASWSPEDADPRLDPEGRLLDRKIADALAAACKKSGKATVKSVKSSKGKEAPPLPFSLSTLQEHLSRRFGIGVQQTLKIAQSLYEKKLSTYPRTDSEYLPEVQHADAPALIANLDLGLKEFGSAPANADARLKSRAFKTTGSAHHAIVPRPVNLSSLSDLSSQERLVWIEIAKRYLLQFFPAAEFLTSEIELLCEKETFRATGKVFTTRGWKDAFAGSTASEEEGGGVLPKVTKGEVLYVTDAGVDSTVTKPPKRYIEGSLVTAMKTVHKFVADPDLKAVLRENIGLGTDATRANIIGELFNRKFIELDKKEIKPTALGEQLIDALPAQLTAPDLTARWQQKMDDIRTTGEAGYQAFINDQTTWLRALMLDVPSWFSGKSLSKAGAAGGSGTTVKATTIACPDCKTALNHVKGKFGWFFSCPRCKASFKDVKGKPVAKAAAPTAPLTVDGVTSGDACPKCKKGTMQVRVCGPHTRAPGKQFLSCSNFFAKGKAKCDHSLWPS